MHHWCLYCCDLVTRFFNQPAGTAARPIALLCCQTIGKAIYTFNPLTQISSTNNYHCIICNNELELRHELAFEKKMLSLNHNAVSLKPSKMLSPVSSELSLFYIVSLLSSTVTGGAIFKHLWSSFFFFVETAGNKECLVPYHPISSHTTHWFESCEFPWLTAEIS